ncbi:MAG: TetR-like C-terminal domain-containing protein [Pseudomonadota bacterium]
MVEETGARPRYHHGDLKAALIEATLALLSKRRLEDIRVADAARAARVSSAAPYRHFTDRDDLLAHVAAEGFHRLNAAITRGFDAEPAGSVEAIVAGGCAYTEFGAANPELFHLMWGAARDHRAYDIARQSGRICYGTFLARLASTMEAEGLGHHDPQVFGAPLWAMVHGFAGLLIGKPGQYCDGLDYVRGCIGSGTRAYFAGAQRVEG